MFLITLCSAYLFSRCLLFVHWETSRKQDAASPITTCQPSLGLNISSGLHVPVHFNSVTVLCRCLVDVVVVVSVHRGTTRLQRLRSPIIFPFLSLPITILAYFLTIGVFFMLVLSLVQWCYGCFQATVLMICSDEVCFINHWAFQILDVLIATGPMIFFLYLNGRKLLIW